MELSSLEFSETGEFCKAVRSKDEGEADVKDKESLPSARYKEFKADAERQLEEGVLLRFERPQRILLGEKKEAMGKIAGEGAVTLARDAKTSAIAPLHVKDESAQVFAMVAALKAIGGMESSGKPVPPANPTSTAAVPPPPPQFTYDKAWILSNAVQNFL